MTHGPHRRRVDPAMALAFAAILVLTAAGSALIVFFLRDAVRGMLGMAEAVRVAFL